MKFTSLHVRNFLTIGEAAPISLDGKGLVLIQGVNEDDTSAVSNGAGKSSIPDALCWALYGTTAREETGDAVVNNVVKKDTSVEVVMVDGATHYRVTRYRKHKEYKNQTFVQSWTASDPGTVIDMSKGTEKETQEVINQIMGCSLDVFVAAIYAGQEQMPDLPKMTDKQLKLLIEEAAGVERLEEAYAMARFELQEAKTDLDVEFRKLDAAKSGLATLRAKIAKARIDHTEFEDFRSARHDAHMKEAEGIKATLMRQVAELKKYPELPLTTELAAIDAQLSDFRLIQNQRSDAQSLVNDELFQVRRGRDEIETATKYALRLKTAYENAGPESLEPCPTCGKARDGNDLEAYKAHLKSELTVALQKLAALKKKMAEIDEPALADAQRRLDAITLPDVTAVSARRAEIADQLRSVTCLKSDMALKKKDYDLKVERARDALTAKNPHDGVVAMLEDAEKEHVVEIGELEKRIASLEERVAICNDVVKVFGPAGVRAHILDTVTPFLNERTADYLSALSDGNITAVWSTLSTTAKGDLKEKFNIDVENGKGAKSFRGLSGGEKRKVRLATMLALQDLVASRATKPIDLWIGDEIDDALDDAGLERLMSVLERKARERGTVLVISHNALTDWVDEVATVVKRGELSVIEGALCEL